MRRIRATSLALIAFAALQGAAHAQPFVPTDASLVVLHVPSDPLLKRASQLEAAVQSQGEEPSRLYDLVESYIELGRRTAEPRYFGRAETLLAQPLKASTAPAELRLQLADILQYRHEYTPALAQIEQALLFEPRNARAHLMRAAIRQAAGDFTAARRDCVEVLSGGDSLAGSVCVAQVLGMTGQIERARTLLTGLMARLPSLPPRYSGWLLTTLADLEERTGDMTAAEGSLRRAVSENPYDHFARLALADLLLAQRRATEVPALLGGMPQSESALLRLAEAHAATGNRVPNADVAVLIERFAGARARGERIHARDLARFNLRVRANPAAALQAARENWTQQREPADARLLVECAIAAGDTASIGEVADWQQRTRYQDVKLTALLARPSSAF
ncbi:MAG TPA: tetratricopeptide repeat protein [Steroidobacteraceae bacterium]|nr:tetratricopeptide repeat protein [Steroidobacteraceae bacterium]